MLNSVNQRNYIYGVYISCFAMPHLYYYYFLSELDQLQEKYANQERELQKSYKVQHNMYRECLLPGLKRLNISDLL